MGGLRTTYLVAVIKSRKRRSDPPCFCYRRAGSLGAIEARRHMLISEHEHVSVV